jgi:hypothetical protein
MSNGVLETEPRAFTAPERSVLLRVPGIGPLVVQRLQDVGIASLHDLRRVGPEVVVQRICALTNSPAWLNRKRALQAAIAPSARAVADGRKPLCDAMAVPSKPHAATE